MSFLDSLKKAFTGGNPSNEDKEADLSTGPAGTEPELSAETYTASLEAQRAEKDSFFRLSPYSPLEPEERRAFTGLNYYPPELAFRFSLPLQPAADPEPLTFQTSTGDERVYYRLGRVEFEIDGRPATLAIYKTEEHDELFLPFRDTTSGQETYGAGRYLEPAELPGGQLLVDFNLAYNPYCAYSPSYSCPLPPLENWLKLPIRAGEKNYKDETEH